MAKVSGLGFALTVQDSGAVARNIANDILNLNITTPRAEQDVTGIDKSAHERLQLLADAAGTLNGVMDTAANMIHDVLKTVSSTSVQRQQVFTTNGKSLTLNTYFNDYAVTRQAAGELLVAAPWVLADGTVPAWA